MIIWKYAKRFCLVLSDRFKRFALSPEWLQRGLRMILSVEMIYFHVVIAGILLSLVSPYHRPKVTVETCQTILSWLWKLRHKQPAQTQHSSGNVIKSSPYENNRAGIINDCIIGLIQNCMIGVSAGGIPQNTLWRQPKHTQGGTLVEVWLNQGTNFFVGGREHFYDGEKRKRNKIVTLLESTLNWLAP